MRKKQNDKIRKWEKEEMKKRESEKMKNINWKWHTNYGDWYNYFTSFNGVIIYVAGSNFY